MKKLLAFLAILSITFCLCSCNGSFNADAMIDQAKEMLAENAFRTTINASGNERTYLHYFHSNGSILEIQGIENSERESSNMKIMTDVTYNAKSSNEVSILENGNEILRVVFQDGKPESLFVNFSGSSYLATSYTHAFLGGRDGIAKGNEPLCAENGCNEPTASKSNSPYCVSHSGHCELCEKYIVPDFQYCAGCTYILGLPVEFSNNYGNESTICNYKDCDNTIAPIGNTNCCLTHSNRCNGCEGYTDANSLFCMDCIEDAFYAK